MPHVGQKTTYHHDDEVYDQAVITRVREGHRVDVAYIDDHTKIQFVENATWHNGAAYGQPPGGGTP